MTGCSYGSGKIRNFAFRGDIPFCNKICFCMAVCLWNGGEMKKGQIRTGVVRNVKFPNRAMVVLEPLEGAADGEEICE